MVPLAIQREVWATYRAGQEIRKDPTPVYLAAAKRAVDSVAAAEERMPTPPTLFDVLPP